ncbi:oocyte zinc finger protein XlCOF26-like [Diorhabda carinulata]|uniref:oocyte zinc finger protein XlCOF26-like n=1 Tax=Diorhabda carinulata TaxID=1163345 RepID=UPI0025A1A702|nr:oocyte zinc finger protein XlCOF26-like [Diorhabda carinulata]
MEMSQVESMPNLQEKNIKKNILPKKLNFKCTVENCGAAYRKKWLLEDHVRKHFKERPFACTVVECTKTFTKEPHLRRHVAMVHEKVCELLCDVPDCGKIFNNKYSLKKHKNKIHTQVEFPFICNNCQKGFNKKWKLNQHMYEHTGEPPFKCSKCNFGFLLLRDLTKHTRNHKSYTCNCGEIFEKWSLLRRHKKNNCEYIVKNCKKCGTTFTTKHGLRDHYKECEKSESEKETFRCPYLNCTRTYLYKRNLNWHITQFHEKDENEEKTFKCVEKGCGKVFSNKYYLSRHVKLHLKVIEACKPRAPRKDKGLKKSLMASILSGAILNQKEMITNDDNTKIIEVK